MFRRIWDDVWPKFFSLLQGLETGEANNALTRHNNTGIRPVSAYTHSHSCISAVFRNSGPGGIATMCTESLYTGRAGQPRHCMVSPEVNNCRDRSSFAVYEAESLGY